MTRRTTTRPVGRIVFVGAGPGDPGLLAVHAADAVRTAEVLVADADVPSAVLALAGGRAAQPGARAGRHREGDARRRAQRRDRRPARRR